MSITLSCKNFDFKLSDSLSLENVFAEFVGKINVTIKKIAMKILGDSDINVALKGKGEQLEKGELGVKIGDQYLALSGKYDLQFKIENAAIKINGTVGEEPSIVLVPPEIGEIPLHFGSGNTIEESEGDTPGETE